MGINTNYLVGGVAFAVAIVGFAGYKQFESTKANASEKLLVVGGGPSGPVTGSPQDSISGGPAVGDQQPGMPNQPGMGQMPPTEGSGPMGSGQMGNAPQGGFQNRPNRQNWNGRGPATGSTGAPSQPDGTGGSPTTPGSQGGDMPQFDIIGMGGYILGDANVQKELKLSDGQKKSIEDVMKPPAQPEGGDVQGMARDMMGSSVERAKKIRDILDDKQEKRMEQLVFQAFGPTSLMGPNFRDRFGISDDEAQKMQGAMQEAFKSLQGSGGGGFDMGSAMKMKEQLDIKLLEVLDADSKAKWKAALGTPFKFANPMIGMGGMLGGGGRRGGGPGGGQGNRPRGGE